MLGTGSRRANYSPINQMSNNNNQNEENAFQPNNTSNHFRSGRDSTERALQDLDFGSKSTINHLEEVYVCNCCGLTRELQPSVAFMSSFKCIFFLFNFLVFVFGFAKFGMGLWFRIDPKVYEIHKYIETQNFTIAGWIMLFCGFLACLMSLIGFAAATRQAIPLLIFYLSIMIALILASVATLVLLTIYGFGRSLEHFLVKEIYEQIRRRAMNTEMDSIMTSDAAQFMDFVQVKMRCCGATDFTDYLKLGMTVPTTCYTIDKNYIGAPGCGHAIRLLFDLRAGLAAGFVTGSLLAQLLSIVSATLIFCSIYHWRAQPKPIRTPTPISSTPLPMTNITSQPRQDAHSLHLQRPRSRTPIII